MTLLDTHIWVWWALGNSRLGGRIHWLDQQPTDQVAISVFSLWEIAKLAQLGRLELPYDIHKWIDLALNETLVQVVPLTKPIAIEANNLPGSFHRDPADQLIVATARILHCDLLTADQKILSYPHVNAVAP